MYKYRDLNASLHIFYIIQIFNTWIGVFGETERHNLNESANFTQLATLYSACSCVINVLVLLRCICGDFPTLNWLALVRIFWSSMQHNWARSALRIIITTMDSTFESKENACDFHASFTSALPLRFSHCIISGRRWWSILGQFTGRVLFHFF